MNWLHWLYLAALAVAVVCEFFSLLRLWKDFGFRSESAFYTLIELDLGVLECCRVILLSSLSSQMESI